MDESAASIRRAMAADGRFLADSWLRSYQGSYHVKRVPPDLYFDRHRRVMARLIARSETLVAVDASDPLTIWGWICGEPGEHAVVHYVYVKDGFRKVPGFSLGSQLVRAFLDLCPEHRLISWTHDTRAAEPFLEGLVSQGIVDPDAIASYDPYRMHE